MENDIDRLIKEREELEDRCMKLTDENQALLFGYSKNELEKTQEELRTAKEYNSNLENLNNRLLTENLQFANALWPLLEQKLFEEIKIMVDDIVDDKLRDYDVTDSAYFVDAVHTEISEYDFDDIVDEKLDDQLSAKIAQVISDGEFIFRR
tara:strand:- start:8 stop:460 length:453 start_codon:yes stop_codon:yes gene_type:complete